MNKKLYINKFFFLLGYILTCGIAVVATTVNAKDIKYTPKETSWNVTNAEAAINDLYNYSREDTLNKLLLTTTDNISHGEAIYNRSVDLSLTKGEYLVFGSYILSWPNATTKDLYNSVDLSSLLTYTNGTCSQIFTKNVQTTGTESFSSNYSDYLLTSNHIYLFKCKFTNTSTVTFTAVSNNKYSNPQSSYINAIKLN